MNRFYILKCLTSSPAAERQDSGWGETVVLMPVGSGDLLAVLFPGWGLAVGDR